MFGRMMVTPIVQVGADADKQTAIHFCERADIAFQNSV